jgi:hypothetical protein
LRNWAVGVFGLLQRFSQGVEGLAGIVSFWRQKVRAGQVHVHRHLLPLEARVAILFLADKTPARSLATATYFQAKIQ